MLVGALALQGKVTEEHAHGLSELADLDELQPDGEVYATPHSSGIRQYMPQMKLLMLETSFVNSSMVSPSGYPACMSSGRRTRVRPSSGKACRIWNDGVMFPATFARFMYG